MLLEELVADYALGMQLADKKEPQAVNQRSKEAYQIGIGPHTESDTVSLVFNELRSLYPEKYLNKIHFNIPYKVNRRQKCDLCIGHEDQWDWAVEIKMLRFMGDNGKSNDNILMHILSPYPQHRSAYTDCEKLINSGLEGRKAILIFAYEYDDISSLPAIEAFEVLVRNKYEVSKRVQMSFNDLVHPVHKKGTVYAWEL